MIWVEVLSRHREVAQRHRCAGPEIRIGRAYDNDIVLDDPYVAAHHVLIRREAGGALIAEDLGSANGLHLDRSRAREARILIDGDRPIRIGHTLVRIREAGHAVTAERALRPPAQTLPILAATSVALLGLELMLLWLGETTMPKPSTYLQPVLAGALVVLAWTAGWAILARIFAGQAHFERHLLIALGGVLAARLLREGTAVLAFALSWRAITAFEYAAFWTILAAICFLHLREVSPAGLKLKAAIVAALAVVAVTIQTLGQIEARANSDQPDYVRRLMPPAMRLSPIESEDAFFAGIEQLKSKLDRDRMEQPGSGTLGAIFDSGRT
jgi:hypothetical protein